LNCAKFTIPGTDIAQNHKGGCPAGPAITNIRATGALTDGMQLIVINQLPDFPKNFTPGQTNLEPLGTTLYRQLILLH
jgi:hypothetical protein